MTKVGARVTQTLREIRGCGARPEPTTTRRFPCPQPYGHCRYSYAAKSRQIMSVDESVRIAQQEAGRSLEVCCH
eukprot:gene20493-biopygen17581